MHQFSKVEMFQFVLPEDSNAALQDLVNFQCELWDELGIHYRVLNMPTQELGASAFQKVSFVGCTWLCSTHC